MSQAKYARGIGLGWAWIKMCRKQGAGLHYEIVVWEEEI